MLGDEYFIRVYHNTFLAWYAQRERKKLQRKNYQFSIKTLLYSQRIVSIDGGHQLESPVASLWVLLPPSAVGL